MIDQIWYEKNILRDIESSNKYSIKDSREQNAYDAISGLINIGFLPQADLGRRME